MCSVFFCFNPDYALEKERTFTLRRLSGYGLRLFQKKLRLRPESAMRKYQAICANIVISFVLLPPKKSLK